MYGPEYQYVLCSFHRCGICDLELLFDLDTLYAHVTSAHDVKIKEYVSMHLSSAAGGWGARPGPGQDHAPGEVGRAPVGQEHAPVVLGLGSKKAPAQVVSLGCAVDADGAPLLRQALGQRPAGARGSRGSRGRPGPSGSKRGKRGSSTLSITPVGRAASPGPGMTINCYKTGYVEKVQERTDEGHLVSNDFSDYMLVECQICSLHTPQTRLRSHTKSAHGITITEYKAQFGNPDPVEPVYHRCGVCSQLIFLDSDAVAVHLKSGGHPRITHKDYNDQYMVDSRSNRSYVTPQEKEERAEQRALQGPRARGIGGTARGSMIRSAPRQEDGEPGRRKMVPTRGRAWGRGRGAGQARKRRYSDDSDEEYSGLSITSKSLSSRRRARMGQGAYDEGTYDTLLKLQFDADRDSDEQFEEDEEWPELKVEEDWGETMGEVNRKMRNEVVEESEQWHPEAEVDNLEGDEEDSNSFSNHATKSLQLGGKKLEVVLLDNLEENDNEEENEVPAEFKEDPPMFNFNTFSTYNQKLKPDNSKHYEPEPDEVVLDDDDDAFVKRELNSSFEAVEGTPLEV